MSKRSYDLLEAIRRKASMSAQIVEKDKDYGLYAGASFETAQSMAALDVFMDVGILPERMRPLMKLLRVFLDRERKAFFASVGCTEISKLGFILGVVEKRLSAIDKGNESA